MRDRITNMTKAIRYLVFCCVSLFNRDFNTIRCLHAFHQNVLKGKRSQSELINNFQNDSYVNQIYFRSYKLADPTMIEYMNMKYITMSDAMRLKYMINKNARPAVDVTVTQGRVIQNFAKEKYAIILKENPEIKPIVYAVFFYQVLEKCRLNAYYTDKRYISIINPIFETDEGIKETTFNYNKVCYIQDKKSTKMKQIDILKKQYLDEWADDLINRLMI